MTETGGLTPQGVLDHSPVMSRLAQHRQKSASAPPSGPAMRNAVVIIAVVVAGAALYWLRGILTPLALAIFLMVMIDSFARAVRSVVPALPGWAAMGTALAVLVVAFLLSAWVIADNASEFVSQISLYGPKLNGLIARGAALAGLDVPPTVDQLFVRLNPTQYLSTFAQGLQSFVSNAVFVLIYLGFLIASRAGFERKWVTLFSERARRREAVTAFGRIRQGIERYLWVQTVTGLMIAAASWGVMALVHLDNAFFWAFLIFVVGYIPIIGPLVGGLFPPVFALVQFPTIWPAVILLAALNAINFIVGNVVLPRMQGESLNLDPVVVLLGLAFWGALWGLAGMFLSTPLTVMIMVVLAQFRGTYWIAVLLSGDGDPSSSRLGAVRKPRENREK